MIKSNHLQKFYLSFAFYSNLIEIAIANDKVIMVMMKKQNKTKQSLNERFHQVPRHCLHYLRQHGQILKQNTYYN